MIMSMRKESGEITTDREEILKICASFYKSLYTQTVPTPESTMKSSPDTEEIPEFTEEEVGRAIKRMKRHKAQGVDGITSDIMKLVGSIVLTYLANIFSNILKGKAKSKVMLQLMHSMCKSYSKTVVYFIHAPSVLRKKAN